MSLDIDPSIIKRYDKCEYVLKKNRRYTEIVDTIRVFLQSMVIINSYIEDPLEYLKILRIIFDNPFSTAKTKIQKITGNMNVIPNPDRILTEKYLVQLEELTAKYK